MAKEATIKARLTLNGAQFHAGLKSAKNAAHSFASSIGGGLKSAITSPIAAIGGLIAGAFTVGAFAEGIKGAVDLGSSLEDLKARTGESADKLLYLQSVLKDNGVDSAMTGDILNKMQTTIAGAAGGVPNMTSALDAAHLSFQDLINLSPADQFRKIGESITALDSPLQRIKAAREIFGKSGGALLGALGDKEGFGTAAAAIGKQAQLLDQNSAIFDRISDRLGRSGLKMQGFFVGVTSVLAPEIDKLTASIDGMDFADQGIKFGEGIKTAASWFIAIFKNPGAVFDVFENYLEAAFSDAANAIVDGASRAGDLIYEGMKLVGSVFLGVGDILTGAALKFGSKLVEGIHEGVGYFEAGLIFAWEKSLEFFDGGWRDVLKSAGTLLSNIFTDTVALLKRGFQSIWDGAKAFWKGLLDAIAKIPGLAKDAKDYLMHAFDKKEEVAGPAGPASAPAAPYKARSFADILKAQLAETPFSKGGKKIGIEGDNLLKIGGASFEKAWTAFVDQTSAIIDREGTPDMFGAGLYRQKVADALAKLKEAQQEAHRDMSKGPDGLFQLFEHDPWENFRHFKNFSKNPALNGPDGGEALASTKYLTAKERRQFENEAVAAGHERAASSNHGYHAVRRGDAKRRLEFNKNAEKQKLGLDKTNELLGENVKQTKGINDHLGKWDAGRN